MPIPLVGVTSCLKSRDDFHFHSVGAKYVDAVVLRRRRHAGPDPGDRASASTRTICSTASTA